jgi:hypothetical protein
MKVLVTGASGFVGSSLVPYLLSKGYDVRSVVRRRDTTPGSDDIEWDPAGKRIDSAALEGFGAVVHLAGENIAGRWTAAKKRRIRDSRVQGTRLLVETFAGLKRPPKVLVSASAIGYYGDRGGKLLDEGSPPGRGFLPEVCQAWEEAAEAATGLGIRVVRLRMGLVIGANGGSLARMLAPFRAGIGGVIGNGSQYWSWIALEDLTAAILHAIADESFSGAANAVSPKPSTNLEFTKTLGRVLSRPTIFPLPEFAAKIAFGEMAEALLLASARVMPARLLASGFSFHFPDLEPAFRRALYAP